VEERIQGGDYLNIAILNVDCNFSFIPKYLDSYYLKCEYEN